MKEHNRTHTIKESSPEDNIVKGCVFLFKVFLIFNNCILNSAEEQKWQKQYLAFSFFIYIYPHNKSVKFQ